MDTFPFLEEFVPTLGHLGQQTTHIGAADASTENELWRAIRAKEIDFCLSWSSDVNMRRLMVEGVDHKSEPERALDDDDGT